MSLKMDNSKISALIIDDSPHIRILVSRYLKTLGFEKIETAVNGTLGLAKAWSVKPDIIFLDGVMPEMDGLTALGKIKKIHADSIVVMITSISSKEAILKFKETGADYYLLKPFTEEKFAETVNHALNLIEERKAK
jgi:CheY-like chemotaxis protein